MIDKNGKLFSKLSIIDLSIIIIIIVLIIGSLGRIKSSKEKIVSGDKFNIVVELDQVRDYTVDAIQIGDVIYEQHANKLGTVIDIKTEGAKDILQKNDGTDEYVELEDRYRLLVTIECDGSITDNGYYSNGNRQLSVGGDLSIQSQQILSYCRIVDIY